MRALIWLFALGACSFPRASDGLACETNDQCDDGRVCTNNFCVVGNVPDDVPGDTARFDCTQWTPKPQHFEPCDIPQPTESLELTMGIYTYNTDNGVLTDPVGGTSTPTNQMIASGMLISVDNLTIATGSTLRVIGAAPLIVASWTDIEVIGNIDAGSTLLEAGGGANPATECAAHAPTPGMAGGAGGGGGGGASFQGAGGNGGDGDNNAQNGTGGVPVAAPLLLGGCRGADGGAGNVPGGPGGSGGGAFQLTARAAITIGGQLTAGGAGGAAGQTNDDGGGGGGGGAGGMIGLEGATIAINTAAIVATNGGGGGEGGDNDPAQAGTDGTATATRAPGGNQNTGGNGGAGSGGITLTGGVGGADNGAGGGGGGGGGAAGFITVRSPAVTKGTLPVISPAETVVP